MRRRLRTSKPRRRWRGRRAASRRGLNIVGYFGDGTGIGEASRSTARCALRANVAVSAINIGTEPVSQWPPEWREMDHEARYHTSVVHDNVALAKDAPDHYRWGPDGRRYVIGYWYWELSELPAEFWPSFELVDEVWVPTRFVRDALRPHTEKPVVVVPPSVDVLGSGPARRSDFGLPEDRFLFLTMASVHSVLERKNPLGVVSAFERAFRDDDRVGLVVKMTDAHLRPDIDAVLRDAAARLPVFVIDRPLSRPATLRLLSCADAYVSLHRSEGFGLPLAEAMTLGKPVVATAYSGNMDFTSAETAFLVDYELTQLTVSHHVYQAGCWWAEPDLDDAARQMEAVLVDEERRHLVSTAGRSFVAEHCGTGPGAAVIAQRSDLFA